MSKKQQFANFFFGLSIVLFVIAIFIPDNGSRDNYGMVKGLMEGVALILICTGAYLTDSAKKDKKKQAEAAKTNDEPGTPSANIK